MNEIEKAAAAVANAETMIITAGAGMGVDSGLPDFRGPEGFWRAYHKLQFLRGAGNRPNTFGYSAVFDQRKQHCSPMYLVHFFVSGGNFVLVEPSIFHRFYKGI